MIERQASLPDLFLYVPQTAQQVVINRPARNISNIWETIAQVPEWVKAQFEQIDLMLMTQMNQTTWAQLIFLRTYGDFSPQDFLTTLNPETEVTYTYKRLEDGMYLFGPKEMISKYEKPIEGKSFFDTEKLKKFIKLYKSYGMTIISTNQTSLGLPAQFEQIFANIEYMIMSVQSESWKISFASHVVFHGDNIFTGQSFTPKFKEYLKWSTIAYLEFGPLASFLPKAELNTSLTGNQLVQQAMMAETLKELTKQHTAIVISKGSNATNLGVTVLAANPNLFASLKPWIPSFGLRLQSQELLSGAKLSPIETENSVGYMITLEEGQQIWCILEQNKWNTKLSIGNPLLDWSSSQKLLFNTHTLATLNIDLDQATSIYKQIVNMWIQTDITNENSLVEQFKWKSLRATIFGDVDWLGLEWEIK